MTGHFPAAACRKMRSRQEHFDVQVAGSWSKPPRDERTAAAKLQRILWCNFSSRSDLPRVSQHSDVEMLLLLTFLVTRDRSSYRLTQ
jgi:hypothetical protein